MERGSKGPGFATLDKDGKKVVWEPGLPADVVRRQHRPIRKDIEKQEDPLVHCDLKATLKLQPSAKASWLDDALAAIPLNRCQPLEIYDVVTHPKFPGGVPDKIGRRMRTAVKESMMFFSEKQRVKLLGKCQFAREFRSEESDSEAWSPRRSCLSSSSHSPVLERRGRRSPSSDGESCEHSVGREKSRRFVEATSSSSGRPVLPPEDERRPTSMELRQYQDMEQERARKHAEQRKKAEEDRRHAQERESQRKAKISSAFLVGGADDADFDNSAQAMRTRTAKPRAGPGSLPFIPLTTKSASSLLALGHAVDLSAIADDDDPLKGALSILRDKAGDSLRSPSRNRWRRRSFSRSRSRRRGWERRQVSRHDRSPSRTANEQKRGQARAARKAKMMEQLLGMARS